MKKLILSLIVLTTVMGSVWALDLNTEPRELALEIQNECNMDNNCIDFKEYILRDIFDTTEDMDTKLNILFTIIILIGTQQ